VLTTNTINSNFTWKDVCTERLMDDVLMALEMFELYDYDLTVYTLYQIAVL